MSDVKAFKGLSLLATIFVGALMAAACTIHLRGNDDQSMAGLPVAQQADPAAVELERCRTITYEQKDRLAECRKLWTERRRQFLGSSDQSSNGPAETGPGASASPFRKDQSRLPSELFPAPTQSER